MSHVVQILYECLGCGRKFTSERYHELPTVQLAEGGVNWPQCPCGSKEFRSDDDSDGDE